MKIATRAELTARRAQAQAWLAAEDRVILVCAGTGCIAGGSMKVYEKLTALCTERGLKTRVALREEGGHDALHFKRSGCQGYCEMGPLVEIQPEGILYTHVHPEDGEVIFKKYSPMGDLTEFAAQICESMGKNTGHIAAVCDRDAIIAVYGAQRRELIDNHCSQELERLMESRKIYRYQPGQARLHPSDASERYFLGVAVPILAEGDLMGAVMLLLDEQDAPLTEAEQKLVQTVAGFLGRQMEN